MDQSGIPFIFLRGGTSRGAYFNRADLPEGPDLLADVLIALIGSGHPQNIDGIGGGAAVTTKVAMLSKSKEDWADVDYFFAQVSVDNRLVDFGPTCGNILAGVGPAAIEMGLVVPSRGTTRIKIRAVNTNARVVATVQTPGGVVRYDGEADIDGVPETAAPILLEFMGVTGLSTGVFLPTGNLTDTINGITVTCMDVAMPMVIARADAFGLTGYETSGELDENRDFFARMEAIRIKAGALMGMGDVSKSVMPKFGLLAPAKGGGTIATRYFMPWKCHPTMAVTGSQCLAACTLTPGTVADGLAVIPENIPVNVTLEHPAGKIEVLVEYDASNGFTLISAGLLRTARKLAQGTVFIPARTWKNNDATGQTETTT